MAKTHRKTENSSSADLAHDRVAARAYELYVARGCEAGQDLDDWLSAERELNRAPAVAAQTANDRDRDER